MGGRGGAGASGGGAGGGTGGGGTGGGGTGGGGEGGGSGGAGGGSERDAGADARFDGADSGDAGATGAGGSTGVGGGAGGQSCPTPPSAPAAVPDSVTFMPNVMVDTLAGGPWSGTTDGPASVATFGNPVSVIVEPAGTLLVCDFDNNRIRRVDMQGNVSTLTAQSAFARPFGFGYGSDGWLYVDTDVDPSGAKGRTTGTLWRIDPVTGIATVLASGLGRPRGFAGLEDGRIILADYQNARVRLLDPQTMAVTDLAGDAACPGLADGTGPAARFRNPYAVVPMPDGGLIVADADNHLLRRVTLGGQVSTYAGDGGDGSIDGPRQMARFSGPKSLAVDHDGNVYVADSYAHRVRRVGADGNVVTVAGDGTADFRDGSGASAQFYAAEGIAISADGTTLFVADGSGGEALPSNRIRRITLGP
jgi:sugar lactone lactonase YvrE